MTPSNLKVKFPASSVFKHVESEIIALNVITILARTGDVWRKLSWDEYKQERLKDKDFTEQEKGYFNQVLEYTTSPEQASKFSSRWKA